MDKQPSVSGEEISGTPGSDSLEHARLKRAYQHLAAKKLVTLASRVDADTADSVLQTLDLASLDSLPHWCLMDEDALKRLQRIAGAVFLAPALQHCIDGACLKQWRTVLGPTLFDEVISLSLNVDKASTPPLPSFEESAILDSGATVLSSTIESHPAKIFFEPDLGKCTDLLPREVAMEILSLANTIYQNSEANVQSSDRSGIDAPSMNHQQHDAETAL